MRFVGNSLVRFMAKSSQNTKSFTTDNIAAHSVQIYLIGPFLREAADFIF